MKNLQDFFEAELFLAGDNPDGAIAFFERYPPLLEPIIQLTWALILYNSANPQEILARAYLQKGDLDKAISEYEKLSVFDPISKCKHLINPKNYYRLARIYEQRGQKAKAIEHYEKFLDLWKDADPGIAEVEDARKRLAGLKQ